MVSAAREADAHDMAFDEIHSPRRPGLLHRPISRSTAVALMAGFELAATLAFFLAVGTSLCSLFGETCSAREQLTIALLTGTGLALAIGGALLVAWLRRAAVWALTPVIIAAVVTVAVRWT